MSEKEFRAGSVNYFSGKDYHRVLLKPQPNENKEIKELDENNEEIVDECEVWTLFFHWKRVKMWGFLKEEETSQDGWKFNQYSKTVEDMDGAWWKDEIKVKN
ncbi:predicted protein [Naegleria gruberi]|uniref:Predicted protein n=1 Tax=Naegleria gruberi TaxID=5762 RepID=D2W5W0_NAEGR|nr:uncharacterized protein NAEGRDRAFT_76804 [Naegleria gruberi]EFC35545.1 predicted protein [Naegleria gruberi]|eukprot:XP_002668289.1 predicted protein [Naegleria gruberi strain NEG-M]